MDANLGSKALEALKPKAKPYKVGAGSGLLLEVTPKGSRLWLLKYRFGGKEKKISMGDFPAASSEHARKERDEARAKLQAGIDPSAVHKAERAESTNSGHARKHFVSSCPLSTP